MHTSSTFILDSIYNKSDKAVLALYSNMLADDWTHRPTTEVCPYIFSDAFLIPIYGKIQDKKFLCDWILFRRFSTGNNPFFFLQLLRVIVKTSNSLH